MLLVVLSNYIPASLKFLAVIVIFFAYFLLRHLWRKHLKKQGKLVSSGGMLFTLFFWCVIIFVLYKITSVESPKLVLYETSELGVFDTKDHFPAPEPVVAADAKASDDTQKASASTDSEEDTEKPKMMNELRDALATSMETLHSSLLACSYLQKQNLIGECSEPKTETVVVELDNDAATVELLFADKKAEACLKSGCKVWLLQSTPRAIGQFDIRRKDVRAGKVAPIAEATLLKHWTSVSKPIIVLNTVTDGWRHLQFTDNVTTWQGVGK